MLGDATPDTRFSPLVPEEARGVECLTVCLPIFVNSTITFRSLVGFGVFSVY